MKCATCHGIGELLVDPAGRPVARLRDAAMMLPCPECGGTGWSHCCDGDRACPEDEREGREGRDG